MIMCSPTSGIEHDQKILLSIKEASLLANVSVSTIRREIKASRISVKRVKRRVLIPRDQFVKWCNETTPGGDSQSRGVSS